jgi:zinc protease
MKRFLLAAVSAALLAGPLPAAAQDVSIPHTLFELDNGLRFIVHQDRSAPIVQVNVWYHVGSGYEEPGRTGFAHLFEHVMFEGSGNVPRGDFDMLLEAAGGRSNGTTNVDRTNYFETVPANALELALWLEADRMGTLLDAMTQQKLDIQRDVVKNERRQSYENQPYGMFWETQAPLMYPPGHPYSWTTIGSMEDLSAATLEDVEGFFRRYYAPNNAVVAVAGDVEVAEVRRLAERFFGWIPRGEPVQRPQMAIPQLEATRHVTLEDRVSLPQLNLMWRTPEAYSADDAALGALAQILAGGRNSRLFRRLVFEEQTAQSVAAFNWSKLLAGDFFVRVTARPGIELARMEAAVLEEIARLAAEPPSERELQRVKNGLETDMVTSLERVSTKADRLNEYLYFTGTPDFAAQDVARFRALTPADVQRAAQRYLDGRHRVAISIVPEGQPQLAAPGGESAR